ncbi:anti-sigma factor RsbA family regulatory protein [Pseudonocardia bannensis]|uniref:Sensor histidine kinase n=1 Tax=Pseudonocardia bannensis TaxID=630973 RepID=A0A848DIN5_9PSEU|nr:sensor histidine kinase [Pseudonocardia bannensis]NMH92550.1 sensor histidine kinase [Pseudonocardia bannensis]
MSTTEPLTAGTTFSHPALFYRDADEFLAGTVPFVLDGLTAGDPVAVAVPAPRLALLRAALGPAAERVRLIDMSEAGRNPGRIIGEVLGPMAYGHPGKHVRIVGEPVWPGRTALEYTACVQHEALINLAFHGRSATILCPYDVAGLAPDVLGDATVTHPVLIVQGQTQPSPDFDPEGIVTACNLPLPEPAAAIRFPFGKDRLSAARRLVADHAARAGLDEERVGDLVLAAGELAANSLRHGGGEGLLRLWEEDDHLVCEISDSGYIADPLAGRRPVALGQLSGRGLKMVHYFADLVRTHTSPVGTTTRVYMRR